MLVLSRKPGQVIEIDGGIRITVVQLRDDRVRLGIEAPPTIAIVRPDAKDKQPKEVGERSPAAA
jgi:carbon storage regulator